VTERQPLPPHAALHIPLVRVRLGEAGKGLLVVVVLLAIGRVQEQTGGEVLRVSASLEDGRVLALRDGWRLRLLVGVYRVAGAEGEFEAGRLAGVARGNFPIVVL